MKTKKLNINDKLCKRLKSIGETKEVLESLVDICEKKSSNTSQCVEYRIDNIRYFLDDKVKKELNKYGSLGFSKKGGTWLVRYEPENYSFDTTRGEGAPYVMGPYVYITRINFLETGGE